MAVQKKYLKSAEGAVASYSYTDLAEGSGVVIYYGGKDQASYILSSSVFYSDSVYSKTTAQSTSDTIQHDLDFDVIFNMPRVVKGNVLVSVPLMLDYERAGGGERFKAYIKCYVRKWDGSSETEIANATSPTWTMTTFVGQTQRKGVFMISVSTPRTKFKKGETLRITIEQHGWNDDSVPGQNMDYCLGHDPKNRATDKYYYTGAVPDDDWGTDPTILNVNVPFEIDL